MFERELHVPNTYMRYFKPSQDAFLAQLRSRDCQSSKKRKNINADGVWKELGLVSLNVATTKGCTTDELKRNLNLNKDAMKAILEMLCMRVQSVFG